MSNIFQNLQTWLADRRPLLWTWVTTDEKELSPPQESLAALPASLGKQLADNVRQLPSHPADLDAIQSRVTQAFEDWCSNQRADSSLVILSSPVVTVARLLTKSLEDWAKEHDVNLCLLPWTARPDPKMIRTQLEEALATTEKDKNQREVVIIPNLSWCFLRCAEGLDGIDYLQDLLIQDQTRFWVIGSEQVSWEYLNSVCQIQSYCGEVFKLPSLEGEQLQQWFQPLVSNFDLQFQSLAPDLPHRDESKSNPQRYFEQLAEESEGGSAVAAQVFLNSIRYKSSKKEEKEEKEKPEEAEEENSTQEILQLQEPKAPKLPNIDLNDQYLLFSLLLHGDLTISELVQSLGDAQATVKSQAQDLRRLGVIEQQDGVLNINPIYYPSLKKTLARNNFVIDSENDNSFL